MLIRVAFQVILPACGRLPPDNVVSPVSASPGGSPAPPDITARDQRLILTMAVLTNLLGNLSFTGLNLGLPAMERELELSAALMGWIPLSLLMAMAAMAAPVAKLSDIVGRRRTTIVGLIFCLAGFTVSALAWDAASLLGSRVLTGLGLAVVFTNITAMATSVHPPQMRGRILGYTIASVYLGLSLGPAVCGGLVSVFGWRSIFWLSAAGFLPPLAVILLVRVEQRPARGEKFNAVGAFLWAAAILSLFFGLTNITRLPLGPSLSAVGLVLGGVYVIFSLKSPNPVLDVRLFTGSRRFAFSSLAAFISFSTSAGSGFILSLYLQYTKGLPPGQAGLLLMVQPTCQALIAPVAGRLSDRLDAGLMASVGMSILCLALSIFAFTLNPETPYPVFIALLVLLGAGLAVFGAPNSNAIIGSAPPELVGQASATITATRLCGQVFSIALTTLVFGLVIGPERITADKYPDFMRAATICFCFFAPICFTGVLASLARGAKQKHRRIE